MPELKMFYNGSEYIIAESPEDALEQLYIAYGGLKTDYQLNTSEKTNFAECDLEYMLTVPHNSERIHYFQLPKDAVIDFEDRTINASLRNWMALRGKGLWLTNEDLE
ncbi:MAG: hypothetical protein ACRCYY_17600 [Trueperaceae bacterium]